MNNRNLKRMLLVIAVNCAALSVNAQYLKSSYFMDATSTRIQMNPALQPTRGYLNIPVLGSFNTSVSSNSLGIRDVINVIDSSDDIFSDNSLYNQLKNNNIMNLNLNTDIFSMGWFKGKNFWSVNMGLRLDIGARLNRGMFEFMRTVNGYSKDGIEGGLHQYDMGHQKMRASAYGEIGVGFSRRLTEKLTVGTRIKTLLGLARTEVNIERFDVNMDVPVMSADGYGSSYSDWMGKGYNYTGKGSVVSTVKNGGIVFNENGMFDDFEFEGRNVGVVGWGLGFDFGASYDVNEHLTFSASVLDLGFLKWQKKNTRMGTVEGQENIVIDGSNYSDIIESDFLSLERFDFEEVKDADYKTTTSLSSTIILAGEYTFTNRKISLGALYSAHMVQPKTLHDITFLATFRPKNWFNIAASYSPVMSEGKSMGIVVKLGPVLLGTDYMYFGNNSKSVNAFLGMSIPLGSQRKEFSQL